MHNYVNARPTESQRSSNEGVIHDALENEVYSAFFAPSDLEDGMWGSAPMYVTGGGFSSPMHWVISDSVVSGVHGLVRRHAEWRDGYFKIRVFYSLTATSGNVYWTYGVGAFKPGTAFSVSLLAEAVAAPASTSGVYMQEFNSAALSAASSIDGSHNMVQVNVGRTGNSVLDTNAGDINLYGVELVYVEKRRMVGGMHR